MSKLSDKDRNRLLRVYKLAQAGVDGERESAQGFLDRLLAQHEMSLEELFETEQPQKFYLSYTSKQERQLLTQIVCAVLAQAVGVPYDRTRRRMEIFATPIEFVEIEAQYSFYRRLWKEQQELAFKGFILAYSLYPPADPDDDNRTELSESELEELLNMMQVMAGKGYRKQLSSGSE